MLFATFFLSLLALFTNVSLNPASSSEIQSRAANSKSRIYCCKNIGQPWYYVYNKYVQEGIDTLKARGGTCAVGAGPKECVDLTCDNQHKIVLCNDGSPLECLMANNYAIAPNCAYLAEYAEDIIAECTIGAQNDPYVCGQQFDTDNYNIIVRWNPERECDGRKV